MKKVKIQILLVVALLGNAVSIHGMLQQGARLRPGLTRGPIRIKKPTKPQPGKPSEIKPSPFDSGGQKRTIYTAERLKGLYKPLTPKAQKVSPLHGAIEFETGAVERRYDVESEAFGPELVQELFYKQGPQFRPTSSKSKAAYALSPEILGFVIGALETGKLQDPAVRAYIIEQWTNEYRKITDEKRPFPKGKIEKLLTLIENEYKHDKNSCCRILLGFLYAKAVPDNDHDMIHYLAGLNEFMPVFVEPSHPMAEAVDYYTAQKKDIPPYQNKSFFTQLQSAVYAMKNYILGTSTTYTPKEYAELKREFGTVNRPNAVKAAINEDFELAVSAMLDEIKTGKSPYPPKVIQSSYGYKGKNYAPDCVETTIHDLLNIMLYNAQSKSFDLSLLPSTVSLNEKFKQFYVDYNSTSKINTRECGQAFMDLVSGVQGVSYIRDDYELRAGDSEKNLLTLANYFFGINAQDLNELGAKLSDERRTITFSLQKADLTSKITMNIRNIKTNERWQADFCFNPGHGWADVPGRDQEGLKKRLFTPGELAHNYGVNSQAQALFRIEPDLPTLFSQYPRYQTPTSFFYAAPVETDAQKANVINNMMSGSRPVNPEDFDYAITLLEQMQRGPGESINKIIAVGASSGLWRTHKKLKDLVVRNWSPFLDELASVKLSDSIKELYQALPDVIAKQQFIITVIRKKCMAQSIYKDIDIKVDEQVFDLIKLLYKEMSDDSSKEQYIKDILKGIINSRLCTTNFIMGLYEQITDEAYKRKFFADVLCIIDNEPLPEISWPASPGSYATEWTLRDYQRKVNEYYKQRDYYQELRRAIDLVSIGKRCIQDGADIVGSATISYPNKNSTTPLLSAMRLGNAPLVELLIDNGSFTDTLVIEKGYSTTPLGIVVYEEINENIVELLLKRGADPNGSFIDKRNNITYPIIFAFAEKILDGVKVLKMLIQYGADVNSRNSKQETLLDAFLRANKSRGGGYLKEQKKVLVEAGAKTSAQLQSVEDSVKSQLNRE